MIPNSTVSASYVGNGVATSFAFNNYILAAGDLTVTVAGVLKTLGVDYTVTLPATDGGSATVNFVAPPANAAAISIKQTRPFQQPTQFRGQGVLSPQAIENGLDNAAMLILQLLARVIAIEAVINTLNPGGVNANFWTSGSGRTGIKTFDAVKGINEFWWMENGVLTVSDTQPA